jgi:hypothetical protein
MSPITSFARIVEGEYLLNTLHADPYATGYFKLNPITASLLFPFVHNKTHMYIISCACDVLTAVILMFATGEHYMSAVIAFLLSPFTMMSELALSSESVDMLLVALVLLTATKNVKLSVSTFLVALLGLNKPIISLVLVFPISLSSKKPLRFSIILTLFWTVALHALCFSIAGRTWSFLETSLRLDLEPTMGFMWNLFAMSFAETVVFFKIVTFGHLFLVGVPIYWRFQKMYTQDKRRDRVVRYMQLTTASMLLFQPYPTAINYALMHAILIACDDQFHDKISKIMSGGLFVGQAFTSAVAPLWLERNTGNANFLFYLDIVSTFLGILAIGQSLSATRLAGYKLKDKSKKD